MAMTALAASREVPVVWAVCKVMGTQLWREYKGRNGEHEQAGTWSDFGEAIDHSQPLLRWLDGSKRGR